MASSAQNSELISCLPRSLRASAGIALSAALAWLRQFAVLLRGTVESMQGKYPAEKFVMIPVYSRLRSRLMVANFFWSHTLASLCGACLSIHV